jgi:hypothetical protein
MPELMLMYRSAAFLIRTYAPEISMGLRTDDEIIDITPEPQPPVRMAKPSEVSKLLLSETKPLDDRIPQGAHADFVAQLDAAA